jgi:hypothetical protein
MIRNLRRLTAVLSVFAYSLLSAQGTCSYSESSSGQDDSNFSVEFSNFDCVDTVTNSFITSAELDMSSLGLSCTSWGYYHVDLSVNGSVVAEDLCEISSVNLTEYGVDINNLTSVKLTTYDDDNYSDFMTVSATLDLAYIVTTCPPPSGVTASNINPYTADISWSSNGSEALWNIELVNLTNGDTATGVATYTGVTVNPYSLSGLSPETEYAVLVQADCGPLNSTPQSDWSVAGTFTTPPTCMPLGAISIDSVYDTGVFLSWLQAGSETSWDIELINLSNTPPDTFTYTPNNDNLATNTPNLTGLTPESNYQFIVRADCGVIDGPGAWTSVYSFTTLPTCQAPVDVVLDGYTNDEITFSWTSIDSETMWYIEYVNLTLGETPTGVADDSSMTTSYTAMNLDANSEYALYVSAACGGADGNSDWSGPVTITTLCNAVAMPYYEPFNTWVPECMDVDNGDLPWWVYTSGGDTVAARARNSWPNYSTNRHMLTPLIDLDQEGLLTFYWSHQQYNFLNDTLRVKLTNDGGANWTTLWSVTGADFHSQDGVTTTSPGTYKEVSLLLDASYVGDDIMLDFEYASDPQYGYTVFIDSIAVDHLPPCNVPYYVTIDSAYTTSADVSFTVAGTGATAYEVEVVESTVAPTGVATSTETGTPFTVSALSPGTDYHLYIRTMCGTDSTQWVGPISFTTECAPVADYYTGFEGYNTGDVPNCWNFISNTTSQWANVQIQNSAFNAYDGVNSVRFYNSNSIGNDQEQLMVGPEFSTLPDQTHRLRFYAWDQYNDGSVAVVGTMSDPTDASTFTSFESFTLTDQYEQYTINFDTYTGTDSHVAIRIDMSQTYSYVYIDEFEWHEMPDCFPPTSITVDGTTTTSITATIDSAGTFGFEFFVEMIDVTGMNPTVLDTFSTTSFTVSGLMPSTVYEMNVSSNCGTAVSEAGSIEVQTDCAPIGDFFTDFENLDGGADTSICWDYTVVTTSTSQWGPSISVGNSTWSSCSGSKYINMYNSEDANADMYLVTPELNNITAGTNLFTFWARSSWGASPFEVGTMTDASDPSTFTAMYSGSVNNSCDSITVPFLSYTGTDTRIAIRFTPLGTYDYLYIDDVRWGPGPDCAMPIGFGTTMVTDEEVTLDWLEVSPDTMWYLELVDPLGGGTFDSIPTDTAYAHPYTIGGLNENTIYDVYLSNPCDTTDTYLQVSFVTPWANDLGVSAIVSPESDGCNLSATSIIEVEITNYGGQAQSGFDVELSWDDTTYVNAGTFMDTLQPGETATFTLDGTYDFSAALDSAFWVQTALTSDSVLTNNSTGSSVTNLGNMLINVQVNTGQYAGEVWWEILDTVNGITAYSTGIYPGYSNYTTYNTEVCVYAGGDYVMNAWDTYDDGWNGGTYSITRCGGIILANNDGNEVTNGIGGVSGSDLEVQEGFHVEECPDDDLAVLAIDGLESACGLGTEVGTVTIMNFGNNDVAANGATAQYQFNNSGLWIDFWNFDTGLESQTDTIFTLPGVDMSITGQYTIEVQIVFAADEDTTTNYWSVDVTSVPTLTEDSTSFNNDNGGWTDNIINGVNNSWEYGMPTTANIGNNNDDEVWATNLTGNGALNEQSYIVSPCYDFSSYVEDVEIEFDYVRTNFNHTFQLQRSIDGGDSWQHVWYPISNTNDWTHQIMIVSGLAGESDVKFRWRYQSTWLTPIEGFGFDNWEAYEHVPYTDATLSDLTVNGNTVSDPVTFDPNVYTYNYVVPYGTTFWNVGATANAPFVTSLNINQGNTLPDTATVVVVAEDNNYTATYTIYITEEPPASDATLSALNVSNASVPGFDPDTLCYTMTFPNGSAFTPNLTAVANDPNADVDIQNTSIPGTAYITVTAEDGVTQNVYCVVYEVEQLSSNALLADLQTDGSTVTGFVADTLVYWEEVPSGTATVPTVTYVADDPNATVVVTPGVAPFPTSTVVTVTAEDGTTTIVYVVNFTEAASSNSNLLDLTVNGGTVTGFDASTTVYDVELPYNSPIPSVVGLVEDDGATVDITDATGVPGTTIILVTAEDGSTTTYYINWTYAAAATDATLATASTDIGVWCATFDPAVNTYTITVGTGATAIAVLDYAENDPNATSSILSSPTGPYGAYVVLVTAEDGITSETYTFNIVAEDCNVGLDEELLEAITVSPNPSTGIFTITTPSGLTDYNTTVVDQLGKVVYERAVIDGTVEESIDLTSLPSGVYNLRINTGNDQIVKRISIIK